MYTPHPHKQKLRKKGRFCYSSKEYVNPFFSRKRKKEIKIAGSEFSWRIKLTVWGCFVVLALLVWLFFYSPIFVIKDVGVESGGRIAPKTISRIVRRQINGNFFVFFPQKNIFFFRRDKLEKTLNSKYALNKLVIIKKPPHTLIVKLEEKEYALIWHENDKYYYAAKNGDIIEEANLLDIGQKDYPLIDNLSENEIQDGQISVQPSYLDFIIGLWREFKNYESDFRVERYIIDVEVNTVRVSLSAGPTIYFNTVESIKKQLNKLIIVKKEKIKDDFNNKSYIDLRYGDRVYYR